MIFQALVASFFLFVLAGYYGAVRAVLVDGTLPGGLRALPEEVEAMERVLYWRRILRMARLLVLALGCYALVWAGYPFLRGSVAVGEVVALAALFAVAALAWGSLYLSWLSLGRRYPALVDLQRFPVRLAEWLLTPLYWLMEPLLMKKHAGASTIREETESADDPDFEDHSIEERMFINALDFKDVRIRDCMIPRTEISAVSLDDTIEDLRQAFISSGHSKIVVYRDSVDEVVGYCHSLALFRKPKEISAIVTPILIVPEAMPASDLMLRFLEERKSLALVVDEFGGTSGLVSVEDVVEQIFGEIQDEYDSTEDWTERQLDEHTYLLSARHEIDYLNDKYEWNLPEGDYDTLAGLLIHTHEDLPKVNEVIQVPPYVFKVISMQDTRIELVRLSIMEKENDA
ncbi:hypothetical protein GCM10027275_21570 [Rhabdobacter roseus]|uniref:CBS domain containing-hemolysin-like protein n=1 Tax=Rhabdobacter roseus TaxID=1655419 RepID=A0A840TRB6_9BACT|nr:hemolysin family protein [Rhabdobacter roseus]MBB5284092.1 CBS domain containing-hemolysin-like protein [Rhabdobacter roseus]